MGGSETNHPTPSTLKAACALRDSIARVENVKLRWGSYEEVLLLTRSS